MEILRKLLIKQLSIASKHFSYLLFKKLLAYPLFTVDNFYRHYSNCANVWNNKTNTSIVATRSLHSSSHTFPTKFATYWHRTPQAIAEERRSNLVSGDPALHGRLGEHDLPAEAAKWSLVRQSHLSDSERPIHICELNELSFLYQYFYQRILCITFIQFCFINPIG